MPSEAATIEDQELVVPSEKIQALEKIVSERNRIQGLIVKAEENKGKVKENIYRKVISEYESKLADVAAEYEPVREEVAEILKSIRKREQTIRAEMESVTDELEELKFRSEVGEFDAEELSRRQDEKKKHVEGLQKKVEIIEGTFGTCKQYLGEDDFNNALAAVESPPPAGGEADVPAPPPPAEPVEEVISVDDAAAYPPPPAPAEDVDVVSPDAGAAPDAGDFDIDAGDLIVQEDAPPPPPPPPAPAPDFEASGPAADPATDLSTGDPELTLSEPIPMPQDASPGSTLDGGADMAAGDQDVEATISFQKRAFLNLIKEDGSQDTFLLGMEPLSIGRNHRNDIVLLDRSISRKHAEVKKEAQGYSIVDLSSGGGLMINGEKTKQAALSNGDEIGIGDFKLVFKEEMGY